MYIPIMTENPLDKVEFKSFAYLMTNKPHLYFTPKFRDVFDNQVRISMQNEIE